MPKDKLEKLLAKREETNAKIRQELGRDRTRKRRQETRKKIIAGALVLAEEDPAIRLWLSRTINRAVKRPDERALFGLAPLPAEPSAPQRAEKPEPPEERSRA